MGRLASGSLANILLHLQDHLNNPVNRIMIGVKRGLTIDADFELIVLLLGKPDSFLLFLIICSLYSFFFG